LGTSTAKRTDRGPRWPYVRAHIDHKNIQTIILWLRHCIKNQILRVSLEKKRARAGFRVIPREICDFHAESRGITRAPFLFFIARGYSQNLILKLIEV
jgi:hypothetical protein